MYILDRFLEYVKYDTTSSNYSEEYPTTANQLVLGELIVENMKEIGISDARITKQGIVYGSVKASQGYEMKPCVGFIAHIDTSPYMSGFDVKPRIIENYDGGDISYPAISEVLSPIQYPKLKNHIGKTMIVTDGSTLLGADNKAGIVAILNAVKTVLDENIPHGRIAISFTPDEEVGKGVDNFNIAEFAAEYAYTVDGGDIDEMEYECFNAASMTVKVKGFNIHPGTAKNKMKNASNIAFEFDRLLPEAERPQFTEGYEGFYHLGEVCGNEEEAMLRYIIRDHSREVFKRRKEFALAIKNFLNEKYGEGTIEVDIVDSYYNMREKIEPYMYIVENAKEAMRKAGVSPKEKPIRGGTDGSRLSYMGLPCPNLPTGGANYHGRFEYIPLEDMIKSSEIIVNIISSV